MASMAASAPLAVVTKTTGVRASRRRSAWETCRPDWSGRRRSGGMGAGGGGGAGAGPAGPGGGGERGVVGGGGERLADLLRDHGRVVIDQQQVRHDSALPGASGTTERMTAFSRLRLGMSSRRPPAWGGQRAGK